MGGVGQHARPFQQVTHLEQRPITGRRSMADE